MNFRATTAAVVATTAAVWAAAVWAADAPTRPVPSNLKPDGLPAIDAQLFEQTERYTASRSAVLLDWNPDRREILINTRFGDVPQIHRVSLPGGAREQLTFFPDRVSGGTFNPADGNEIVFSKDAGGDEFYQLYLLNTRDGRVTRLTEGERSRNQNPLWSRSGKRLVYTSTKRDGEHSDIWIMDPHNPSSARVLYQANDPGWQISDWSADETKLLLNLYRSAVVSELYLMDVGSGRMEKLGPAEADANYAGAKFSLDGKGAYLTSNEGNNFERLGYLSFSDHRLTPLRPDLKWDVSGLELSRDGQKLAYVVNEDGVERLHVLNTQSRKELQLPEIPPGTIGAVRWRPSSDEIGFSLASAHTPGDTYSIRLNSNSLDRWTFSETGGLDAAQFSEPRLIHWKSFDGTAISGFLYPAGPKFSGPRPVIIDIHGGPEGQSQPIYQGQKNFFMQELGVAVIFPNVRGSSGFGKTFLNADNGIRREDSVKDIGALLDWIKTQPDLDASRIMVTGGSYGGYMTLAVMTHYSDRVRCAVEAVGISNFRTFLQHTEAYRRDLRRVEYGDERDPKMRDFFETIAPLNNAAKITKPMFIIAGRNDPRVPWTEGQQMTDALRKQNVPTWFLVAEDEGHGFAKKTNRDYLFAATVEFVQRYLLN
jgi:dipeptidyl aminopeptidase/acylaminoacyl peptidase